MEISINSYYKQNKEKSKSVKNLDRCGGKIFINILITNIQEYTDRVCVNRLDTLL